MIGLSTLSFWAVCFSLSVSPSIPHGVGCEPFSTVPAWVPWASCFKQCIPFLPRPWVRALPPVDVMCRSVPLGVSAGLWCCREETRQCRVGKNAGSGSRLHGLKTRHHHFLLLTLFSRARRSPSLKYPVLLHLHLCDDILICSGKDDPSPRTSEPLPYVRKKRHDCKLRVNIKAR